MGHGTKAQIPPDRGTAFGWTAIASPFVVVLILLALQLDPLSLVRSQAGWAWFFTYITLAILVWCVGLVAGVTAIRRGDKCRGIVGVVLCSIEGGLGLLVLLYVAYMLAFVHV